MKKSTGEEKPKKEDQNEDEAEKEEPKSETEQSKSPKSEQGTAPKKPDLEEEKIEIPETKVEVKQVMSGIKVSGEKRDRIGANTAEMIESLPNGSNVFSPSAPTYPWMFKDTSAYVTGVEVLKNTSHHNTIYYVVKDEIGLSGPWTDPKTFTIDVLQASIRMVNRLIGVTNSFKRDDRIELGRHFPVGVTDHLWESPEFRKVINQNTTLRRAWDIARVADRLELDEGGRFGLGQGRPGDGVTGKIFEYQTMTQLDDMFAPLASVKQETLISKYFRTPRMVRDMMEPFGTNYHRPAVSREVDLTSFHIINPATSVDIFSIMGRQSPGFVTQIFELISSMSNVVKVGQTERFVESMEISRALSQRVNEILPTSNMGTQITSVNSDRVFLHLATMSLMGDAMELRFRIPKPEERDPTVFMSCLSYLVLTPDNLLNVGDAERCLQYIFIHYHARHEVPSNTTSKYVKYEEDRMGNFLVNREEIFAQFPANQARNGLCDLGYDNYQDLLANAGMAPGSIIEFFSMLDPARGYYNPAGHAPPNNWPASVNGVQQYYPFRSLPGSNEFVGRWGLLINYLRTMRELNMRMDDSTQVRMYRSLTRLFVGRGSLAESYMSGLTKVTNTLRPLGLHFGHVAEKIPLDMKPTDLVSLLYTVDMKTLYIDTGIYDFVLWSNAFKADLVTYGSLATLVYGRFQFLKNGSERREILKMVLAGCRDFFAVPETQAFFELLNREWRPAINAVGQGQLTTMFTDAIVECEQRVLSALPKFGYSGRILFRADVDTSRITDLTDAVFQGDTRRTGLDYAIVSNGIAGDDAVEAGFRVYDRKQLSLYIDELTTRGVIASVQRDSHVFSPYLSTNYPFVKFMVKFDSPQEAVKADDNRHLFETLKMNQAVNMTVRVRDNDEQIDSVRIVKQLGETFMISQNDFGKYLQRLDPEDFGKTTKFRIYQFDASNVLTKFTIENLSTPYRFQ
jgi:hypothetical protein